MRVVFLLTVLAVVIAAGLQEGESQELEILQREARDAGRRKGKAATETTNKGHCCIGRGPSDHAEREEDMIQHSGKY